MKASRIFLFYKLNNLLTRISLLITFICLNMSCSMIERTTEYSMEEGNLNWTKVKYRPFKNNYIYEYNDFDLSNYLFSYCDSISSVEILLSSGWKYNFTGPLLIPLIPVGFISHQQNSLFFKIYITGTDTAFENLEIYFNDDKNPSIFQKYSEDGNNKFLNRLVEISCPPSELFSRSINIKYNLIPSKIQNIKIEFNFKNKKHSFLLNLTMFKKFHYWPLYFG